MKKFLIMLAIFVGIVAAALIVMHFHSRQQVAVVNQADAPPKADTSTQSAALLQTPPPPPASPTQPRLARVAEVKYDLPPARPEPQPIRTIPIAIAADQMEARLIRKVPAHVPRSLGERGTVVFNATINESGQVVTLDLLSKEQELEQYARSAVMQWQYKPYLLNDKAEAVQTVIMIQVGWDGRR